MDDIDFNLTLRYNPPLTAQCNLNNKKTKKHVVKI